MDRWVGKVAVVTGASAGIGSAIVEELVKAGVKVVALARRLDRLEALAKTLSGAKGEIHPFQCDITKEQDIIKAIDFANNKVGPIHILVNNAGIVRKSSLSDGDTADWRLLFETNVIGLCVASREAIKSMKKHDVAGHIININSVVGHKVPSFVGHELNVYPASKHAVTAITESLRQELLHNKSKIKATSLSPGLVETEIDTSNNMGGDSFITNAFSTLECLKPIDIAKAAIFVLGTPPHVLITELTIRPLDEP